MVRTTDGQAVAKGRTRLSKAAADKTEDAYKRNYNGTDVFEMDFSQVREPGEYVVAVEGVGCSYPFPIAERVWRDAFTVSAKGFLPPAQRHRARPALHAVRATASVPSRRRRGGPCLDLPADEQRQRPELPGHRQGQLSATS